MQQPERQRDGGEAEQYMHNWFSAPGDIDDFIFFEGPISRIATGSK